MRFRKSSIPCRVGGIVERFSSDNIVIVKHDKDGIYMTMFNLSEWVKNTEDRLKKLEELAEADNYEYRTKLVKRVKE